MCSFILMFRPKHQSSPAEINPSWTLPSCRGPASDCPSVAIRRQVVIRTLACRTKELLSCPYHRFSVRLNRQNFYFGNYCSLAGRKRTFAGSICDFARNFNDRVLPFLARGLIIVFSFYTICNISMFKGQASHSATSATAYLTRSGISAPFAAEAFAGSKTLGGSRSRPG